MKVEAQVTIAGTRAAIWTVIADIEHAAGTMTGIEKIDILERPARGLVGLTWRETRVLFGKPASADKWITDAVEEEFYEARAESDGFVFLSSMRLSETSGGVALVRGVATRALLQDLHDIKRAVERG